jgi:hypothetical protein
MSTGLKGLSEVVKAVLDDRESSGRNARPPATPDLSLVMRLGQRFESARRLSFFTAICGRNLVREKVPVVRTEITDDS